jgi:hypothetical protein
MTDKADKEYRSWILWGALMLGVILLWLALVARQWMK